MVVALPLLVLPAFAAHHAAAQSLAGMVLDVRTRAPMAHVRVRLATDSGDVVAMDTSRANGVFYLNATASGKYLVVFESAEGAALLAPQPVTLQADSATQVQYLLDFPADAHAAGSADAARAYTAVEVDVPARLIPPMVSPARGMASERGSSSLRQMAAMGESSARAEFVVDTTGRILLSTVRILETTGSDATRRLTQFLATSRYEPATKDGRRVQQIVHSGLGIRVEQTSGRRP